MAGSLNARLPRARALAMLASSILLSMSCGEPRPLLSRPTPVTGADWQPPSPGQHVLSGVVIEPDGRPVEGATVFTRFGKAATDTAGRFRLERIGPTTVDVQKEGYEARRREVFDALATMDLSVEFVIAPMVRLPAGASYSGTLFPKDVVHAIGDLFDFGGTCRGRLIRLQVSGDGPVSVRAEWPGSVTLTLFVMAATIPWPELVMKTGSGSASASVHSPVGFQKEGTLDSQNLSPLTCPLA